MNEKLSDSLNKYVSKLEKTSVLGVFSIIVDPMFIVIAITTTIYTFSFVSMMTIIIDFARDLEIGTSNEKYVLMTLSVGDLVGRLGLGWITDRGYMTTTSYTALCFGCQGLTTVAIVWSGSFIPLITLTCLHGFVESGILMTFPVIISQYFDPDKQAVAISSSHFLSGPLCLAISPMIGK